MKKGGSEILEKKGKEMFLKLSKGLDPRLNFVCVRDYEKNWHFKNAIKIWRKALMKTIKSIALLRKTEFTLSNLKVVPSP